MGLFLGLYISVKYGHFQPKLPLKRPSPFYIVAKQKGQYTPKPPPEWL